MMIKRICCVLVAILLLACVPFSASAESAYKSYNYTTDKKETASPDIYTVSNIVYGSLLPCGSFVEAQDMFVDDNDRTYLLDSGNARLLIFDKNYNLEAELKTFTYGDKTLTLAQGAEGLFYQENSGKIFIADTNNNRIIVCNRQGIVSNIFEKPESVLLSDEIDYKPSKIIVDNNDNMYIVSKNVNTGAIMTDQNNQFIGFFGTNKVKETAVMKLERLWQKILKGSKSDYSFQPVAINNLFWGKDRFVYSVSTRNEYLISEVSKLNALGNNVFTKTEFADLSAQNENVEVFDIAVDHEGFFSILDRFNGKVYTYDADANLIGAFGGIGEQEGLFKIPTAISYNSAGELVVLDSAKNTITVMQPTEYALLVFDALKLFQDGQYVESMDYLNEAIKINPNFSLIYTGLGKANYMLGNYDEALRQFELGNNKEQYSDAKQGKRNEFLTNNFALIAVTVVLVLLMLVFYDKIINWIKNFFKKLLRR